MINPDDLTYQGEIPKLYPHLFTENQWLWTYRNRDINGLSDIVYILNNKGYLDMQHFGDWLGSRRETNLKAAS